MRAAGHGAYREAADYFERALVASARLPQDRRLIEQDVELRFALRNALWPAGEFDRILPHLREAIRGAEALADEPRIARSCSFMSQYFWIVSDYKNAIESGLRAETIGRAHNDLSIQVSTNLHLGLAYHALGDYHKCIEVLGRNVDALTEKLVNEHFGLAALPSVYSRTWLAWSLAELGEFREGLQAGRDEVKIAEAAGHPLTQINALFGIGYVHLRQGGFRDAVAALERAFALCESVRVPFWQPVASSLLGYAYALSDRVTDALPLLESAVGGAAAMHRRVDQALWSIHLSEALLWVDRIDDARGNAQNALQLARQHGERGNEAHALRIQGEALSRGFDDGQALDHYQAALKLAELLNMRPLIAHCRFGLGKFWWRCDKRHEAEAALLAATTMYRNMGMHFWLEQAEAALTEIPTA